MFTEARIVPPRPHGVLRRITTRRGSSVLPGRGWARAARTRAERSARVTRGGGIGGRRTLADAYAAARAIPSDRQQGADPGDGVPAREAAPAGAAEGEAAQTGDPGLRRRRGARGPARRPAAHDDVGREALRAGGRGAPHR